MQLGIPNRMDSLFDSVQLAPPDAIFGRVKAFQEDPRPNKLNLLIGFYKTEQLLTPILESVKQAEKKLIEKEKNKEYLPIDGSPLFAEKIGELLFGAPLFERNRERIYGAQTVGGTGALYTLGKFFHQLQMEKIWISDPTWPNHPGIFKSAGLNILTYPYYDKRSHRLSFDQLKEALKVIPRKGIILLHANCHNPTGFDLSKEEWKELSELFFHHQLFPFFDSAYQGFGSGLEEDGWAVRYFLEQGHEMAVAYSCAKNFSLYGERAGALFLVSHRAKNREKIQSQIKSLIRASYSNPPMHPSAIITEILQSASLTTSWKGDLDQMRERMRKMRHAFLRELLAKKSSYDFRFMEKATGLFSYSGLDKQQVEILVEKYGIYLPGDGRINVTCLNDSNLKFVADAIVSTIL